MIKERQRAQEKMIQLMLSIYDQIKEKEKASAFKILVMKEDFDSFTGKKTNQGFGMKVEPFLLGDAFGFTIYRDTLSNETIMNIFNYYCKSLDINFSFHTADGYYETNDYTLENKKYFRGYCIQYLTTLHKGEYKRTLK